MGRGKLLKKKKKTFRVYCRQYYKTFSTRHSDQISQSVRQYEASSALSDIYDKIRAQSQSGRHDTQHNDSQHNNKNATPSITTISKMTSSVELQLCCVSYFFYCYSEYPYAESRYAECPPQNGASERRSIRVGCSLIQGTNALAYCSFASTTQEKSFIWLATDRSI